MKQRPDAQELERLAAAMPPDADAYRQRLAAKALSIAAWDREHGEADRLEEWRSFEVLCDASGEDLGALNARLATEIRVGTWDAAPAELTSLLMAQVKARLRRSNPKYLKAREGGVD